MSFWKNILTASVVSSRWERFDLLGTLLRSMILLLLIHHLAVLLVASAAVHLLNHISTVWWNRSDLKFLSLSKFLWLIVRSRWLSGWLLLVLLKLSMSVRVVALVSPRVDGLTILVDHTAFISRAARRMATVHIGHAAATSTAHVLTGTLNASLHHLKSSIRLA